MRQTYPHRKRRLAIQDLILFAWLATLILGCSTAPKATSFETQEVLVRSGFKLFEADTPEKLSHLKSLPQRQVVSRKKDGKLYYVFADDAAQCRCLYAGDEKAYHRYLQQIEEEKRDEILNTTRRQVASDRFLVEEINEDIVWDRTD
jgi:hypothetical protein